LKFDYQTVSKPIIISLTVSLLLLIFDTIWRLENPIDNIQQLEHYESVGTWFYKYKFNSIMFADSNLAGVAAMTFSLLSLYLYNIGWGAFFLALSSAFFIINLMSFSRSSITTNIIIFIIIVLYKKCRLLFLCLFIPVFLIVSIIFLSIYYVDESFITKIQIYNYTFSYFTTASLETLILGLGFGGFFNQYDISAHAIYATYLVEIGLLGSLFFLFFIINLGRHSSAVFFYGILPFLISGLSYYPYAGMPFFFITLALLKRVQFCSTYENEGKLQRYRT
jgi:hypothetical protein